MDNLRGKYRVLIIVSLIFFGLTISLVYNFAIKRIEKAYKETVVSSTIESKKTFIKDTVNNVLLGIERKREDNIKSSRHLADDIEKILGSFDTSDKEFVNSVIDMFENNPDFSAFVTDAKTGNIIYSSEAPADVGEPLRSDEIQSMKSSSSVFSELDLEEYKVIFFVDNETIDEKVKSQIHDEIHSFSFSNDAYIWVNEVINYDGGDNYAIRRIHPNLKDTEGMYLSTNMTDIAGNRPYLTELEGVKKDGELFFRYFFKKNNSDIISEKITFAKLYKEYNWIIAMGVHLDDVKALVDQSAIQNDKNIRHILMAVAAITAFLIVGVLAFVSLLEKWYFRNTRKVLDDEIYKDALTIAYNRKGADNHLKSAFSNYKSMNQNAAVVMLDIDDFKKINDDCGHDKGDFVLKDTADILNRHIRSTDYLCRWGGDEFIIICNGLREDDILPFTNKLLEVVSSLEFECPENMKNRHITISMGVSRFMDSDTNYNDSVRRADKALYRSKANGKNTVTIEL